MRAVNTLKVVESFDKVRNRCYDLFVSNISDLYEMSGDNPYNLVTNAFRFGYVQGCKATKVARR